MSGTDFPGRHDVAGEGSSVFVISVPSSPPILPEGEGRFIQPASSQRDTNTSSYSPGLFCYIPRQIIILIAMLVAPVVSAVNITVTADRDPASLNESFVLTFEADGSVDDDPDFSPLNRDFQVLSTGESSNMSIINGRVSSSKTWALNVMARRAGELPIPPVAFGRDLSTPSSLTVVKEVSRGIAGYDREIFLEVAVNADHPYVQSEVIYTVRLFRSVATANATLSDPPDVSGVAAVVEKIGEDRSYDTRRQGDLFGVVERKYAIYPQGSGRLTIGPMIFQGQISRGLSLFGNPFGRQPQTVSAQSEPITLDVKAIPAAFKGAQWLPARGMSLMEEWSEYPLQFKIDEPLTRTLTLTATGLTASQLPEFPAWPTDAFKQYPDQPVLTDDKQSDGVIGKRIEKIAMIPGRAGTYTLPEISIPWWNTVTDKLEYATIPERQIEIVASAAGTDRQSGNLTLAPDEPTQPSNLASEPGGTQKPLGEAQQSLDNNPQPATLRYWQGLSLILFVIWIVTLLLWRKAKRTGKATEVADSDQSSQRILIKQIKQACLDENPARAKELLLQWGRMTWPDRLPTSIGEIANRCSEQLAIEIGILNNVLYSRTSANWKGPELWQAFEQELKVREQKPELNKGKLEPLFKI